MNPYGAPEITPSELKALADSGADFIWLDVREPWEMRRVQIADARVLAAPLSELSQRRTAALPEAAQARDAQIVVQCHHGVRSAQVTAWLLQQGWSDVRSLAGGVDAWAREIDPAIGVY